MKRLIVKLFLIILAFSFFGVYPSLKEEALLRKEAQVHFRKAKDSYKKAGLTMDTNRSTAFYKEAYEHASQAIKLGERILNITILEECQQIQDQSRRTLELTDNELFKQEEKIRLQRIGDSFFVDVVFNEDISTSLQVDTGCDVTLISPELAKRLKLTTGKRVWVVVADGRKIAAEAFRLRSVEVGGCVAKNVEVVVHKTNRNGLLGMSFFQNFVFKLDPEKGFLYLESK